MTPRTARRIIAVITAVTTVTSLPLWIFFGSPESLWREEVQQSIDEPRLLSVGFIIFTIGGVIVAPMYMATNPDPNLFIGLSILTICLQWLLIAHFFFLMWRGGVKVQTEYTKIQRLAALPDEPLGGAGALSEPEERNGRLSESQWLRANYGPGD